MLAAEARTTTEQLASWLAQMCCNAFTIQRATAGGAAEVIGCGIFVSAALLNHSCDPNCCRRLSPDGTALEIVALRDIDCDERLCTSYITLAPETPAGDAAAAAEVEATKARRAQLQAS